MHRVFLLACLAATTALPAANASPMNDGPTVSAYLRMPLDGRSSAWEDPQFGLRLDRTQAAGSALTRPGIVDLKYRRDGLQGLDVLGVNTLGGGGSLNATGNQHGSWARVGLVVAGGALAMCVAGSAICRKGHPDFTMPPASER